MSQQARSLSSSENIGKTVMYFHFTLLLLALLFYFFRGFDLQELIALFAVLAPVAALYGGVGFRLLSPRKEKPKRKSAGFQQKDNQAGDLPAIAPHPAVNKTISRLVYGHFILIALLISLKALAPNILSFTELTVFLGLVESYFGVHLGSLLLDLFE